MYEIKNTCSSRAKLKINLHYQKSLSSHPKKVSNSNGSNRRLASGNNKWPPSVVGIGETENKLSLTHFIATTLIRFGNQKIPYLKEYLKTYKTDIRSDRS